MIIRNGIQTKLRARGRSLLFFILILILTLTLSLGYGITLYCRSVLTKSDEIYHSIIKMEYLGVEYPSENEADSGAREVYEALNAEALENMEGVIAWYPSHQALYSTEGYTRYASPVPFSEYGILRIGHLGSQEVQEEWIPSDPPSESVYVVFDLNRGAYRVYENGAITEYPLIQVDRNGLLSHVTYTLSTAGNGDLTEEKDSVNSLPEICVLRGIGSEVYKLTGHGSAISHMEKQEVVGLQGISPLEESLPVYRYDETSQTYLQSRQYIVGYGSAIIKETLFSNDDPSNALIKLYLNDYDFRAEANQEYLIHGYYGEWTQGVQTFYLDAFLWDDSLQPYVCASSTGEEDSAPDPGNQELQDYFVRTAQYYKMANNSLIVTSCPRVELLEAFHQKDLIVEKGNFPTHDSEVLITPDLAGKLSKSVGDTLIMTRLLSNSGDRFHVEGVEEEVTVTICGITSKDSQYVGCVWSVSEELTRNSPLFGYTLGILHVENADGVSVSEQLKNENALIRATLLDQGYAQMVRPLKSIEMMARLILILCMAGVLTVLILFAYLFVGREKESLMILHSLGVSRWQSALWVLSGAWVISGAASLIGGILGSLLLDRAIQMAISAAQQLVSSQTQFSEISLGTIAEETVRVSIQPWSVLILSALIFLLCMLLCFFFLRVARRQGTLRKGKSRIHVPRGGTDTHGRGSLRFALLSIRRGGGRSLVVPLVSLTLTILLIVLCFIRQSWALERENAFASTRIQGEILSTNGNYHDDLVIDVRTVRAMAETEGVKNLALSHGWNYWLPDEMPHFASNSFGEERRQDYINSQPKLVALNDLSAGKDFYYSKPLITWLAGWDEKTFLSGAYEPFEIMNRTAFSEDRLSTEYPILIGSQFAQRRGLKTGDTLQCGLNGTLGEWYLDFTVVGIFKENGSKSQLYVPLSCYLDPEWILGEDADLQKQDPKSAVTRQQLIQVLKNTAVFTSARFEIPASLLENTRDQLWETGFSEVRNVRSIHLSVLLRDASFGYLIDDLNRQIALGQILFTLIIGLIALLGFVISWLMINGRKTEFAIMRGLGAPRIRVFFSFFWEQAMLCLTGFLPALLILLVLPALSTLLIQALGLYLLAYAAGCTASVLLVGRMNLMELLTLRD